jgi:hypothetical protein
MPLGIPKMWVKKVQELKKRKAEKIGANSGVLNQNTMDMGSPQLIKIGSDIAVKKSCSSSVCSAAIYNRDSVERIIYVEK